jgi:hypothetical protein
MACGSTIRAGSRWELAFGVALGDADFMALTAMAGDGYSDAVNLVSGVLMDVRQDDKLRILETCNHIKSDNLEFPVFLHIAPE